MANSLLRRRSAAHALAAIMLTGPALPVIGTPPPAHRDSPHPPIEAVADARHDLALGFSVRGRVAEVAVQPGSRVTKGQPLVRLDDREGEAQVKLFELRSGSGLEIDAAEAGLKLDQNEERRIQQAVTGGGANEFELQRAKIQSLRSELAVRLAQQRRDEARAQFEQANAQHAKYTLLAPIDGVIEELTVAPGELVDESRPVLRLVVTSVLAVDAPAPMEIAARIAVGDPAWVTFRTAAEGTQPIEGQVVQVASVADAGSERRRVRLEIPNPRAEPAGSHVTVSFTRPTAMPAETRTEPGAVQPNAAPVRTEHRP